MKQMGSLRNKQAGILIFMACLWAGMAWADAPNKPAYQIADNTFFDPTRKQKQEESYSFRVDYRLEVGYAQHWQRPHDISFPEIYLHGIRLGATFDFHLPLHFTLQTGVLYSMLYGQDEEHWRSMTAPSTQAEYITHHVLAHNLTMPIRVYYTIPLWRELNLLFFTGPQLHIGLAQNDYMKTNLSDDVKTWLDAQGIHTSQYDRMADELVRANIQWGVGAGLEWERYRLQGGYDFGLNNMVKHKKNANQYMSEWGWFVTFSYRF